MMALYLFLNTGGLVQSVSLLVRSHTDRLLAGSHQFGQSVSHFSQFTCTGQNTAVQFSQLTGWVTSVQFSQFSQFTGRVTSVQFSQFTGQDTAVQFSQLTGRVTSVQFSQSVQSMAVDTPMSRQFCQRTGQVTAVQFSQHAGQVTTVQLSSVQSEPQAFQCVGVYR